MAKNRLLPKTPLQQLAQAAAQAPARALDRLLGWDTLAGQPSQFDGHTWDERSASCQAPCPPCPPRRSHAVAEARGDAQQLFSVQPFANPA